jgi:acetylornithine deacetylase/succinyl-diaminopimelate desuccinylase-like protein
MDIEEHIKVLCHDSSFRDRIVHFLQKICEVDTTPTSDVNFLAQQEALVFQSISFELQNFSFPQTQLLEKTISPAIETHPNYSKPYYTVNDTHLTELTAQETYRNRYNLVYEIDHPQTDSGRNVALNAHIDVVAPFYPPRREGNYVYGRGSADDKGNVAAMFGALAVLDELSKAKKVKLNNSLTAMFVIEEETGGNGSLDLVLDQELKRRYDSILILECAENKIYPGNRGAIYFKCIVEFQQQKNITDDHLYLLSESFVYAILEIDKEGRAIREESDHSLFPHRPVQTCQGILGPFGQHPSTICGEIACIIRGNITDKVSEQIKTALFKGLSTYIDRYGDKTKVIDTETGTSRLKQHFDYNQNNNGDIKITVYGLSGHAGSLFQNDAAITKWAYMMQSLLKARYQFTLDFKMEVVGCDTPNSLVLEGSQGFLPTHEMETIKTRIKAAFSHGVDQYIEDKGLPGDTIQYEVSFNKLHNDAFACDPESDSMHSALQAGIRSGIITKDDPVVGWDVSCDARLFAKAYPDMSVITSGVGHLIDAHSDHERVFIPDLMDAIFFTALFLLIETGSI